MDIYSHRATSKWITKHPEWPEEFLKDVLVKVLDTRAAGDKDLTTLNTTDYLEPEGITEGHDL